MLTSGNFEYTLIDTSATITRVIATPVGGILTIPTLLDGNTVVAYNSGQYSNVNVIRELTFPPYLTSFNQGAFRDNSLTSIRFLGNLTPTLRTSLTQQSPFANSVDALPLTVISVLIGDTTWPLPPSQLTGFFENPTVFDISRNIIPLYTLTYDFNDEQGSPFLVPVSESTRIILRNGRPRSGYTFNGWFSLSSGGTLVGLPGASYTINATRTLYGQWTSTATYTITYDSRGGTSVDPTTGVGAVSISSVVPTRSNFVYVAWTTQANGGGDIYNPGDPYTLLANLTLYAQWKCSIVFELAGGSPPIPTYTQSEGTQLTLITPIRLGYSFKGWFTASSGGTLVGSPYTLAGDATLYAQWELSHYTITYDEQGGSAVLDDSVSVEVPLVILPYTTRTGFDFAGWFTASSGGTFVGTPDMTYSPNPLDNTTLYARWTTARYTITYESEGGSPVPSDTQDVGTQITLPATTLADYMLDGWYSEPSGGIFVGRAGDLYTIVGPRTLYAQWTIIQYTLTYDSQGGTAVPPNTQNAGTSIPLAAAPDRPGYTFLGWYSAPTNGQKVNSPLILNQNVTVYAQWYSPPIPSQGVSITEPRNCRPLRTQTILFPRINYNVRCCPSPVYSLTSPSVDASGVVRFQSTYPMFGTDMYHMFVTNLSGNIQYTKYFKNSSSYASGVLAYPGTDFLITVTAFQDGNPSKNFTLLFP